MNRPELRDYTSAEASGPLELELPVVRVIRPVKRRVRLRHLPRDGPVIRVLAARDFKVKYKQSVLGPLWLVFQPLALLAAFFVAFRNLADVQPGIPYSVFALVGLSVWAFFQASMIIGASSLISNSMLVRFTPCPRFAFPTAAILASLPTWAVTTLAAGVVAAATGTLSPRALLWPLGLVWLFMLTWGVAALAASFSVRYRDILAAMPFLLQVGVFLAPIGYPLNQLGGAAQRLVELNPLTGLVEACRWMMVSGYHVSPRVICFSLATTAIIALAGWRVFTRLETTMADNI